MAFRSNIPSVTFDSTSSKYRGIKIIETTVTDKASITEEWGSMLNGDHTFLRSMSNKSATLQLCTDTKCLILQLFYMDEIPQSLKNFLLNPIFTFVGVEVEDDILKLKNEYGLDCSKSADIRSAAMKKWPGRFRRPGLKDLAMDVLGLHMKKPKHVCMSNWEARLLNENQIEYACIDAYASYKIAHKILLED
ncbi:3'-5' exonuclease domain-containing protein [Artemisia annua]|uniref:3'-5' exonuclease domain-containing protein n=1 Tax=Artemisia annua TaxID=35608 RepID=A0A2U1LYZ6_ARTAN|nr:3'-5' exonuclease domain-containing protein [Artemisia annua]